MTSALMTDGFWAVWNGDSPLADDVVGSHDPDGLLAELDATGRIELDTSGRIRGIHGVSLDRTAHHIAHAGGVVHTWCAFDAIGIPAALAITADAVTTCPTWADVAGALGRRS